MFNAQPICVGPVSGPIIRSAFVINDIKLSNDNIKKSLSLATKFLHNDEFKNVKVIDARIKNQVILND